MCKTISLLMMFLIAASTTQARQVGVFCFLSGSGMEVYEDENIRAQMTFLSDAMALIEVENLTNRILYIDRGRSFVYVNDESSPMFIPSARTEAYTVGRAVITTDGEDVAWLDGEAHTSSHTLYDQRLLVLAPRGKAMVYMWDDLSQLLARDMVYAPRDEMGYFCASSTASDLIDNSPNGQKFHKGDSRYYSEEASPLHIFVDMSYRFNEVLRINETTEAEHHARLSDYVSAIIIGPRRSILQNGEINYSMAPDYDRRPYFAYRCGNDKTLIIGLATVGALVGGLGVASIGKDDTFTYDTLF